MAHFYSRKRICISEKLLLSILLCAFVCFKVQAVELCDENYSKVMNLLHNQAKHEILSDGNIKTESKRELLYKWEALPLFIANQERMTDPHHTILVFLQNITDENNLILTTLLSSGNVKEALQLLVLFESDHAGQLEVIKKYLAFGSSPDDPESIRACVAFLKNIYNEQNCDIESKKTILLLLTQCSLIDYPDKKDYKAELPLPIINKRFNFDTAFTQSIERLIELNKINQALKLIPECKSYFQLGLMNRVTFTTEEQKNRALLILKSFEEKLSPNMILYKHDLLQLAYLYWKIGQKEQAANLLDKAVQENLANEKEFGNKRINDILELYFKLGQTDKAVKIIDRLVTFWESPDLSKKGPYAHGFYIEIPVITGNTLNDELCTKKCIAFFDYAKFLNKIKQISAANNLISKAFELSRNLKIELKCYVLWYYLETLTEQKDFHTLNACLEKYDHELSQIQADVPFVSSMISSVIRGCIDSAEYTLATKFLKFLSCRKYGDNSTILQNRNDIMLYFANTYYLNIKNVSKEQNSVIVKNITEMFPENFTQGKTP